MHSHRVLQCSCRTLLESSSRTARTRPTAAFVPTRGDACLSAAAAVTIRPSCVILSRQASATARTQAHSTSTPTAAAQREHVRHDTTTVFTPHANAVNTAASGDGAASTGSKSRSDQQQEADRLWSVKMIALGSMLTLCATVLVEASKVGLRWLDDQRAVDAEAARVLHLLDTAQGLLRTARREYLRRAEAGLILSLLAHARMSVEHAHDVMNASLHRDDLLASLTRSRGVPFHDLVADFHAHIAYHKAAVELRSEDDAAVQRATELLAESLARRQATSHARSRWAFNETSRVRVKLGDVYSRARKPAAAMNEYAAVYSDQSLFRSFWAIRAKNNEAVVHFGHGQDEQALTSMREVAADTASWLSRHDLHLRDAADARSLSDAVQKLIYGSRSDMIVSAALLQLVNMGADDAVDVLHLAPAVTVGSQVPQYLNAASVNTFTGAQEVAIEYLERVRLMLRKYVTSRASTLLIACAPCSTALVDQASGHFDGELLLQLLEDAVSPPLGKHGATVYTTLDREWIEHVGATRMLSAVGVALVELAGAGALPAECRDDALALAERLTRHALQRHAYGIGSLPDLHSCVAAMARARYIEVSDAPEDASDDSAIRAALHELQVPASNKLPTNSVLSWSTSAQLKARGAAQKQLAFSFHASTGVPPRTARWQATVLAYGQHLEARRGSAVDPKQRDALLFAVTPFDRTHPMRQLASGSIRICTPRVSAPLTDLARVRAALAAVRTWMAQYGVDMEGLAA